MYNSTNLHRFNTLLKRELSILLKQSTTYISFILLTIISEIYFFVFTGFFAKQECDLKYFFSIFPYISIIAIPCLSFNIFKSESIINSIAISDLNKILAKWFASFIVFTFSILITITTPILVNQFGYIETSQAVIGYFTILFYGAMLIALSIFIQTILKNKIASLILTVIILFIFNNIHIIPKYINLHEGIFFNILQNFSFAWHYDSASKGIFNTKDFCFYIFLSFLFLYLSNCFYKKQQGKKINLQNILVILICFFLLLDSNLFYTKIDFTKSKKYSLTKETEQIIKDLSHTINITYAYSPELAQNNSQIEEIKDFIYQYGLNSNNINVYFEKVTSQNDEIKNKLKNFEIPALQIENENSLSKTSSSVYSAIILETTDNYKTIPFIYSNNMLEYLLTSNILALETKKAQSVIVHIGNNLTSDNGYLDIIEWLKFSGFTVYSDIEISKIKNTNIEIPLLLLGSSNLTEEDCINLENEFFKGRKFLVATSPNTINIDTDWLINQEYTQDNFIEMLKYWGIYIDNTLILDKECYQITFQTSNYSDEYKKIDYPFWIKTENGIFYWPSPINFETESNFKARILQKTSNLSWTKNIYNSNDELINTSPLNEKNLQPNIKTQNEYNLVCEFSGNFNGLYNAQSTYNKMILISDQYFASKMLNYTNNLDNLEYISTLLLELTEKDFLVELKNKSNIDLTFSKINDEYKLTYLAFISIIITVIFPLITVIILVIYKKFKK